MAKRLVFTNTSKYIRRETKNSKKYKQNSLTLFHLNCPLATPTIPPNFQPVWRQAGFEPVPLAWQASALPLGYLSPRSERIKKLICHNF